MSGYARRHDEVIWRNTWTWRDVWRNGAKACNVPVIVNKFFIIIGIGCGRSKDDATKHIMIGLRLHVLMMCWMGTRLGIWMKAETHIRMKDELRFGFGLSLVFWTWMFF